MVKIGAPTEPELKERKGRVEDALAATRAAVAEGVVPGGGVAFVRAISALDDVNLSGDEAVAKSILAEALQTPARIIASNSNQEGAVILDEIKSNSSVNYGYDAVRNDYTDLVERGIIDPTKGCPLCLGKRGQRGIDDTHHLFAYHPERKRSTTTTTGTCTSLRAR